MGVRYIDGIEVAIVRSHPIRKRPGLSHRPHCVHQHRVVLAEDQSRRDGVKTEGFAEGLCVERRPRARFGPRKSSEDSSKTVLPASRVWRHGRNVRQSMLAGITAQA